MARIFLDSGVLLEAGRGTAARQEPALALLEDPEQTFLTSPFVHLETVPKARYNRRQQEAQFYEEYFARAEWTRDLSAILEHGIEIADRDGVGPMDALHVAAAALLKADELVTVEKPRKSIYRARAVQVRYLYSRR